MYYGWSKEFLEAGKRRLAGDTARAATPSDVKDLRREATALKEVVADLTLENRLLKKRMARPVCKCFVKLAHQPAPTYPVSGTYPGQDGAPRIPILISMTAIVAIFLIRLSECRSTVSAIFTHPPTDIHKVLDVPISVLSVTVLVRQTLPL